MLPVDLQPGAMWDERYRIVAHLGSGAAAHALRAEDRQTDEVVALKVLNLATFHAAPPLADEILGDAWLRTTLRHPSIVPVRRYALTPRVYSVAEFSSHHSPDALIAAGPPSKELLLGFAEELVSFCLGLRHVGVIWLDVSLSNVNLADQSPPWRGLRVVDLGACLVVDPTLRRHLSSLLTRVSRESEASALVTQARRIRLLLRLVATWRLPDAMRAPLVAIRPDLGELSPWLDHRPHDAMQEEALDKWAALLGAKAAKIEVVLPE